MLLGLAKRTGSADLNEILKRLADEWGSRSLHATLAHELPSWGVSPKGLRQRGGVLTGERLLRGPFVFLEVKMTLGFQDICLAAVAIALWLIFLFGTNTVS